MNLLQNLMSIILQLIDSQYLFAGSQASAFYPSIAIAMNLPAGQAGLKKSIVLKSKQIQTILTYIF